MPTDAGLGVEPGHPGQDIAVTILDEAAIRAAFDRTEPLTIGLEEEVLLLDPGSLLPIPAADDVVAAAGNPSRIKRELPACQVELVTAVHEDAASAIEDLRRARGELLAICDGEVAAAAAAVHPNAAAEAITALGGRHGEIEATYGMVARRQLVGALQVHVAVGSADRTLRVYNALRSHLPLLAALAASAPFHEGRDTGLASVRPLIAGQLPRQGVPPLLESWAAFADDLSWGARSGVVSEPRRWWWELRPHVVHGTIEVRVPDVQADPLAMTAIVTTVHALVAHLADPGRGGAARRGRADLAHRREPLGGAARRGPRHPARPRVRRVDSHGAASPRTPRHHRTVCPRRPRRRPCPRRAQRRRPPP